MWVAECRIILSEDIIWLLLTILRKSNFWQNFTNCPLYLYQIFLSTCQFIFFTSCQFRLSRQQSRCQNILFLWSSSLWDRREDFLPIPNFWMSTESKVCVTVNSNCLFTLNSVGLMFLVLMFMVYGLWDFKPANKWQNKGQTTLTSLKVIIKFDLCGAGLGLERD